MHAVTTLTAVQYMRFIPEWCDAVCNALQCDPRQLLVQKHCALAQKIRMEHDNFPDLAIVTLYVNPLTSWSGTGSPPMHPITSGQPDLALIATFCLQHFSWTLDYLQCKLSSVCAGAVTQALLQVCMFYAPELPTDVSHSPTYE
jgi:hypothetical protein